MARHFERRPTLDKREFSIGLVAVIALVVLRVTIGWHFLYEGVWKINPENEFSAKPFLATSKGPAAELFYAMLPDLNGVERLSVIENTEGEILLEGTIYRNAWYAHKERFKKRYNLNEQQAEEADKLYKRYDQSLREYGAIHGSDVAGYLDSLQRMQAEKHDTNRAAPHMQERLWNLQMKLRGEASQWLTDLDAMGEDFQLRLWEILSPAQKAVGMMPDIVYGPNRLPVVLPGIRSQMDWLDTSVTYGLTAIGLLLMLGLFSRLAALGGAAFLVSVLLTQPPWPTIYPPAPPVVGHALVVDKNFVEMVALLVIAALPVGRWAGLDFFVGEWVWKPLGRRYSNGDFDAA